MAVSDMLKKPVLKYTPDKVVLPEETTSPGALPQTTQVADDAKVQNYELLTQMLLDEMDNLEATLSAVVSCVPDTSVVVDQDAREAIGKTEVGLSDYLASLEATDPASQMLCEVFEVYHAENGSPELLLARPLASARSRLQEAFTTLPKRMRDAFTTDTKYICPDLEQEFSTLGLATIYPGTGIDPSQISEAQLQYMQRQIDSAQELRSEIGVAAEIGAQLMDNDLWPTLFKTRDLNEIRHKALEFAKFLRKLRTVLVIGTLVQTKQWRSITRVLSNYVTNHIVRTQLNLVRQVYSEVYQEIAAPVQKDLAEVIRATEGFQVKPVLGVPGTKVENIVLAINTIAETCDSIISLVGDHLADVLIIKEKQSASEVESVRVTNRLLYQRRLIMLLDIVIEALLIASRQPLTNLDFQVPPSKLAAALSSSKDK